MTSCNNGKENESCYCDLKRKFSGRELTKEKELLGDIVLECVNNCKEDEWNDSEFVLSDGSIEKIAKEIKKIRKSK